MENSIGIFLEFEDSKRSLKYVTVIDYKLVNSSTI